MKFNKILNNIKSLKIQGAENVAISAVKALRIVLENSKAKNPKQLISEVLRAKKRLISTRPTEPFMRNSLNFICNAKNADLARLVMDYNKRINFVEAHFKIAINDILNIGSRKIKNGMVVFTHCHSSTVTGILKMAKALGRRFEVYNTETRPLLQGRITAQELSKAGINVTHFVDSAARIALKKADIMLLGCDAITTDKIYNKIGSEMMVEIANRYDIPVYICTDSWKFDPESIYGKEVLIEERSPEEVWKLKSKRIRVSNLAFEKIDPNLITGIISEFGIYKHNMFIDELRKKYYWMF